MKRLAATLMVGTCLTLTGGGIAQAYPPDETSPASGATTVPTQDASPPASGGSGELPATGSNGTASVLLLAAGLSGSGLLLAGAVRRRRPTS